MRLTVVCLLADPDIRCVVVPQCDLALVKGEITDVFEEVTNRLGLIPVHLNRPWQLQSLRIAKPWGAEIWYTGIEARGVCTVNNMPLPWLIAVSPRHTLGNCTDPNPILLKILDPHSEPEFGDLYFELHELKTEVYVVTHVDKTAWPDGHGQIRYGFNQARRAEFESIDVFKSTYLEAVNDYQKARDEILLEQQNA